MITKQQLKKNLSKFNPDALVVWISFKDVLEAVDLVPSEEIDTDAIRFDLRGNIYIEYDEFGFSGDWWKK